MGGHGYGAGDAGSGFHGGGHFVHMRGLPFRATENDIANVSTTGKGLPHASSVCPYPSQPKLGEPSQTSHCYICTKLTSFYKAVAEVGLPEKSAKLYLTLIPALCSFVSIKDVLQRQQFLQSVS